MAEWQIQSALGSHASAIFSVHTNAFPTLSEARLVEKLELSGDAILSLIAVVDAMIVGHVLFSQMDVTGDGKPIAAAGLAPVAVLPAFQRRGIADALIREGLRRLPKHGMVLSFVLGNPDYYGRFGYSVKAATPFESPYAGPHFMALGLDTTAILPERGVAAYAPAFS